MLTHLQVSDFTLVKHVELTLESGLTVLTGETGAGKSILLDALGLALGDRAEAEKVRPGAQRAEVNASFDVAGLGHVRQWLAEAELGDDECIVRRMVTAEGRSKAFINGRPVTLTQLRRLGERLIDIHSQHEHQSLLHTATHRRLLDAFGNAASLTDGVKRAYQNWAALSHQVDEIRHNSAELNARYQLLRYQVEELDQLALQESELEDLEARQRRMANAETIKQGCSQAAALCCGDEDSAELLLSRAVQVLEDLPERSHRIAEARDMLANALIQVQEAGAELARELDVDGDDDYALVDVEQRLSAIYDIARKHRVPAEELAGLHQQLAQELGGLRSGDEQLEQLESQLREAEQAYEAAAERLSRLRRKTAKALAKSVNGQLAALAMERAKVEVSLTPSAEPTRHGNEQVEFLISTVPGQPTRPLGKIASGGELSRVSLAIQVVTAKLSVTPVLVFDEVDVGIGGATGDVVGQLLRELGQSAQVLCVTHLAQVASKAHHHLKVEKAVSARGAATDIRMLDEESKVGEIARMMGGAIDSQQSLAHAREMLQGA